MAEPKDADFAFALRNDTYIAARSTSRRTVSPSEHAAWFAEVLEARVRLVLIVQVEDQRRGIVRFDRSETEDDVAVISVYLEPDATGRGAGTAAIVAAGAWVRQRWGIARVRACVRNDNAAGARSFAKAGYAETDATTCPPAHRAFVLSLSGHDDER